MRGALARPTAGIALALGFGFAGPTAAQSPDQLPRKAVEVAGPTAGGAVLYAYPRGDYLCGSPRWQHPRSWSETCSRWAPRLRAPTIAVHSEPRRPRLVWGFVAQSVGSVEIVFANGGRNRTSTRIAPSKLGERARGVRFFVLEAPAQDRPLYARLFSSDGTVLGAVDATYGAGITGRVRRVAVGRAGRLPWAIEGFARRVLLPLPDDQERVVTRVCVRLAPTGKQRHRYLREPAETCDDPDFPERLEYNTVRSCDSVGLQVLGLVPPNVRRLAAVLGTGERRTVPLKTLPAGMGPRRAFAMTLGSSVALRSLTVRENDRTRRLTGAMGPGEARCGGAGSQYAVGVERKETRFSRPPALALYDRGPLLCATLGLPDPQGRDCGRPPIDEAESRILAHVRPAESLLVGVVPAAVSSVTVDFYRRTDISVPTAPSATYAGRYRNFVRTFSVSLPPSQAVRGVKLRDDAGSDLITLPPPISPFLEGGPRAVLHAGRAWAVGVAVVRSGLDGRRLPCLQLAHGNFSTDPFRCAFDRTPRIMVTCDPKAMIIYGRFAPAVRRLDVVTDRGVFSGRAAALKTFGFAGRVFLAEVPRGATPEWLVTRGSRVNRLPVRLPAASRQCGYRDVIGR